MTDSDLKEILRNLFRGKGESEEIIGYLHFYTRVYRDVSGLAAWSENCK
jgi:hypothetical protein